MPLRLIDIPRPVSLSKYDETRAAILKRYETVPGVRALLEFGTVSLPGFSDIDMFAIVEAGKEISFPAFHSFSEEHRYAMGGRQVVLSERLFPFLNFWDPWFVSVRTISGDPHVFTFMKDDFSSGGYEPLSLNFLFQKAVYGSLPLLARIRATGELPCRTFFADTVQYQYFLREFRKTGVEIRTMDAGAGIYRSLFEGWFELSPQEQQERMERGFSLFPASIAWTIGILSRHLEHLPRRLTPHTLRVRNPLQASILRRYPGSFVVDAFDKVFVYQKGREGICTECQQVHLPGVGLVRRTLFVLPLTLACFPASQLGSDGPLSAHVRSISFTDLPAIPVWEDPHLLFSSRFSNLNLEETSAVRHAKYYEYLYGYVPSSGSLRGKAGRMWNALHHAFVQAALLPSPRRFWEDAVPR